jgi:predicted 2-oxoglutarate/Fe(II)-dependent dioxygenase YbiX
MVRDDGTRSLLFDSTWRFSVSAPTCPTSLIGAATAVYHSLLRRWADL